VHDSNAIDARLTLSAQVLFKKHGCFATMMTGNLIKGTCALVDAKWADARFFGCMILSYLAGCSGQRILDQRATPCTKSRVIALATFLLFRCSDVFGGASARRGALWLAAGFGLVNAVSVDVLLTITWMLTIHMQKLTNYATDAVGLSGAKAKASAKFGPVLRRSCVVLALFAAGVGAGHYFCEACLDMAGFSTLFGAWYALIVLSHDQGRVGLDSLGKALLLNKNANPGLLDE
jgi:uncharacterized membrane protein YoaK (UPF0700 family)